MGKIVDSTEVERQWAERSGEFSPEYYAHYGPDETSDVVRRVLECHVDSESPILELGCSSGRHLSHLHDHGFTDLAGIEVNGDAREVMERAYPELADSVTFHHGAIDDVVRDFEDGQFAAVFSVETLQHLHPEADRVFDELVRITDGILVTGENEGETERSDGDSAAVCYVNDEFPLYYRDWNAVFTARGFVEVAVNDDRRDTIRTFRSTPESADR